MSGVEKALEQLVAEILVSDIYKEYDIQRNKVNEVPDLKEKINEYRIKNFELQMSEDNALDKIDQFEREYAEFRENPLVSDFLAAELAFCRMIQQINTHIAEAIHFE